MKKCNKQVSSLPKAKFMNSFKIMNNRFSSDIGLRACSNSSTLKSE
jgi:hypothetical protein